ncbi:hypothetical protein BZG36_03058 [Bifiguratus adelaidae]|uniref:Alpha/beta hydrolase fold-3 domain-containing protein n=1 Tax=Bifiguratus adelaidae TaxID=1938954 RepID=A0A261XZG4_9FUNG|nr:hypothetical protein BZG36_03058 [Bifiguratus adelaidae]
MLDHLLGKPSANWKRCQVLILCLLSSVLISKGNIGRAPRTFRRINNRLARWAPWQIALATWTLLYISRNSFLLLGFQAKEPLARLYKRSFYRATWVLTALDAGFLTALPIQCKWLRDICSILFTGYYILHADDADEKVRRVRATVTIEEMRCSWEKQTNPYLTFFSTLQRPKLATRDIILLERYPCHETKEIKPAVKCHLYYRGNREHLHEHDRLILHFPGGGFVSMPPPCHEDAISYWCHRTGLPLLSVDYGKAPERPYPWALEECFDVYRRIMETNGACIGLRLPSGRRLQVVLIGDSAGGNLVSAVTLKTLVHNVAIAHSSGDSTAASSVLDQHLPVPTALIVVYPALNFDFSCWMSPAQLTLMRTESSQNLKGMEAVMATKDHLRHKSPLSVVPDVEKPSLYRRGMQVLFGSKEPKRKIPEQTIATVLSRASKSMVGIAESASAKAAGETQRIVPRLAMTSRMSFFNDRIIGPDLMRAMAILYLGPHSYPDFSNDYFLSPLVAPVNLLAKFPKTYLLCGEKDPFVDDTVLFAARLRQAKRQYNVNENENVEVKIMEGISHAFLQMTALLPEAKDIVNEIGDWMNQAFANAGVSASEVNLEDAGMVLAGSPQFHGVTGEDTSVIMVDGQYSLGFGPNQDDEEADSIFLKPSDASPKITVEQY